MWVRAAVRSWVAPGSAADAQISRPAGSAGPAHQHLHRVVPEGGHLHGSPSPAITAIASWRLLGTRPLPPGRGAAVDG
jgi:hypothetical protein